MSEGSWIKPLIGSVLIILGLVGGAISLVIIAVNADKGEVLNQDEVVTPFVHSKFGELDEDLGWMLDQIEDEFILDLTKMTLSTDVEWTAVEDDWFGKIFFTTYKGIELRFAKGGLFEYKIDGEWEVVPCKLSDIYVLHSLLFDDEKEKRLRKFKEYIKKQEGKV